jgi:acetolactate synthase-1/3 small subunit
MKKQDVKPVRAARRGQAVIELTVHNHPGVMSHVCGLFARRAFNLEGIACLPVADGARSRVWLSVEDDRRMEQMVKQLQKLRDVIDVRLHKSEHGVFTKLEDYFRENPEERPKNFAAAGGTN